MNGFGTIVKRKLKMNFDEIKKSINNRYTKIQIAKSNIQTLEQEKLLSEEKIKTIHDCQELTQKIAQGIQQKTHSLVAEVVTKCLETVFEEPYTFNIEFERKRGKTEARLVFERNGMEIDPMTSSGGGVLDVAAFALRLSAIILTKPHTRKLIVMDEPFRFLSESYREKIRKLLQELSIKYDFQFIMVTHIKELVCGRNIAL